MNLEQQVKHLDKHYRDGNALITDKEFDILEKQLLAINPDSDYFTNRDALPLPSLEKDPIEDFIDDLQLDTLIMICLLYTSPSPRDLSTSRMPSSA